MNVQANRTTSLEAEGNVRIDGARGGLALIGSGDTITLRADSLRSVCDLARCGSFGARRSRLLREIHGELARRGLSLEFRVRGMRVARLGRSGRPALAGLALYLAAAVGRRSFDRAHE